MKIYIYIYVDTWPRLPVGPVVVSSVGPRAVGPVVSSREGTLAPGPPAEATGGQGPTVGKVKNQNYNINIKCFKMSL